MNDRYEPLPGITRLPGWLVGKLSPRGRRVFWILTAIVALAFGALAVVLVPRIVETKHETRLRERREAVRMATERARLLRAEQRPRHGRSAGAGAGAVRAALERAIVADVGLRRRAGTLHTPAKRAECNRLGTLGRGRGLRLAYGCTAVTSVIPRNEGSRGGVVGYPYRALADPRSGRFAFCKVSGQPGEGSLTGRSPVSLPRACGG